MRLQDMVNEDVLFELLLRLPCKSVIRFKCVSKHWYSVISDSTFIPLFLNRHHMNDIEQKELQPWAFVGSTIINSKVASGIGKLQLLLGSPGCRDYANSCFNSNLPFPCGPYPQLLGQRIYSIVGSSDDLILCRVDSPKSEFYSYYYVCNPLTKQSIALPPPPPPPHIPRFSDFHISILCEPICTNRRYRVVHIAVPPQNFVDLQLDIFSSETGLWGKHLVPCPSLLPYQYDRFDKVVAARLGQSMVCVVVYSRHLIIFHPFMTSSNNNQIIQSRIVDLPINSFIERFLGTREVFPSQGCLVLCCISNNDNQPGLTLTMWKLEVENQNEWSLIHQSDIGEMKVIHKFALTRFLNTCYKNDEHKNASWVAEFLRKITSAPRPTSRGLEPYEMGFVGIHPFDVNVIFFILNLDLREIHMKYPFPTPSEIQTSRLVSYDMRTRVIELVPEENMIGKCDRQLLVSILVERLGFRFNLRSDSLVVFQPWPTSLREYCHT